MENKIEEIREAYSNNIYKVVRHYSSLYGKLSYSRALPKYMKENINFESIDTTKPFCLYTNDFALITTPIMCSNSDNQLRYIEISYHDQETGVGSMAWLYNQKTNSIRILMSDMASIAFLLSLPPGLFPSNWQENLKVI